MRRSAFVASLAAFGLTARSVAAAQDEFDPATSASTQSLRVLLGAGDATPNPAGGFTFGGRAYRGTFSRTADGAVVNTLSLEEYVYSVVPREMPPSWPAAALQAQAICARTYVLQRSNPRRAYDVVPSEIDQVYDGISSESPAGRAAVDATTGQVVRFADGFAQIMYSSCCGGRTEAASDAWGGSPLPYLEGVACTHCTASPQYRWQRTIGRAAVAGAFAQELSALGSLQGVRVATPDDSGRAKTLELITDRGSAFVAGNAFRMRLGTRVIPSLLITDTGAASPAAAAISIEGGGLGHGVGLCQWGARGYAQSGGTARDILSLYFPGTSVA
ncbi:MAG: SpoIID/LytB domain-containing protein [Candidatus Baltobacteraceae bacterium]